MSYDKKQSVRYWSNSYVEPWFVWNRPVWVRPLYGVQSVTAMLLVCWRYVVCGCTHWFCGYFPDNLCISWGVIDACRIFHSSTALLLSGVIFLCVGCCNTSTQYLYIVRMLMIVNCVYFSALTLSVDWIIGKITQPIKSLGPDLQNILRWS